MEQQIKVVRVAHWTAPQDLKTNVVAWAETEILTAWEGATSPDGVRPALEGVYPLGEGLALLVFSGDLARSSALPPDGGSRKDRPVLGYESWGTGPFPPCAHCGEPATQHTCPEGA